MIDDDDYSYEREREDEMSWIFEDAFIKRCPRHGEIIGNEMFDGVCGGCEGEMSEAAEKEAWEALPSCEKDKWSRMVLDKEPSFSQRATCQDVEDDIPFLGGIMNDWVMYAKVGEVEVRVQVTDLDGFIQAEGEEEVYVAGGKDFDNVFHVKKKTLSNFFLTEY